MSLPGLIVTPAVKTDEPHNVKVTTSDCETTSLALLGRKFPAAENDPIYSLPIRKNGSTRFSLPAGHYLFVMGFENVDGPAVVNIEVVTSQDTSTEPNPLPQSTELTAEKGSTSFDVFV